MSLNIERARTKKRVTWLTIVGVILLPVLIGGVLVASLWNPTERLDGIRAAIVNNDEPVTINGQMAPLGRQLTAGLVEGSDDIKSNIDWVISNTDDAADGMADGTYQAVITIPEDFSGAATSTAGDDPRRAVIDVKTSDEARMFDSVLTSQIASIAAQTMGEQLSNVYVASVLDGFTQLNDQLGTAANGAGDLADGAKQSADGTTALADGVTQLADGASQTADGAGQLADGTSQLADGAGSLADGAGQLSSGVGQLAPGAEKLASGTAELAEKTGALGSGLTQLGTGLTQLSDGAAAAVDGVSAFEQTVRANAATTAETAMIPQMLLDNTADASAGSQALVGALVGADPSNPSGLVGDLGALAGECYAAGIDAAFCERIAGAASTAGAAAAQAGDVAVAAGTADAVAQGTAQALPGEVAAGLTQVADGLAQLRTGTAEQPGGLEALAAGAAKTVTDTQPLFASAPALVDGVNQLASGAGALSSGLAQTQTGAAGLADGASTLASGTRDLSSGASALADGTNQLATGTSELADGAGKLNDGIGQLSDGTKTLADGLTEAVDKIPTYTKQQREDIAEVVSKPVTTSASMTDSLFGGGAVPLLAIVALWFGGLASYVAIQAVSRRALASRAPSALLALKSFIPGALIGAVQGVLLSFIVQFATKWDLAQWFGFAGLAALAGIVFAAVNQALVAVFGGIGRWISAVIGVLFFATGIISTTPGFLLGLADALPTAPAFRALLSMVTDAGGMGGAITGLIVWLLVGLVATTLAVVRRRSVSARGAQAALA